VAAVIRNHHISEEKTTAEMMAESGFEALARAY